MTALATISEEAHDLQTLVDRASSALANARTAAEVLDARDMAGLAYDVAKRAARLHRAKAAHDDLIAAAHRSQAHALEIEAAAKRCLADEYDAAQQRGEVAKLGDNLPSVVASNSKPTAADLGLRRDQIHEARLIRNAEAAIPASCIARSMNGWCAGKSLRGPPPILQSLPSSQPQGDHT